VANALTAIVKRSEDTVARYGSDQFVILLPNTPLGGARQIAEKACRTIRAWHIPHPRSEFAFLTVSIGVASTVALPINSPSQLLDSAEEALFTARAAGSNCVRTHTVLKTVEPNSQSSQTQ
jgi:diguanylate cyclase (GGDEF)-like protein